jgi:hypothetical protein
MCYMGQTILHILLVFQLYKLNLIILCHKSKHPKLISNNNPNTIH